MIDNDMQLLKIKCNKQVDKILELEDKIKQLESDKAQMLSKNLVLEEQLKKCENSCLKDMEKSMEKNENLLFFESFLEVVKKVKEDQAFIHYKNQTKNSSLFCKIEKDVFDRYVNETSPLDYKTFIRYCVLFSFFKMEKDGRYLYTNNNKRVFFINKNLVEAACSN